MSKAQTEFIDQRTRQLLVKWCDYAIRADGTIPDLFSIPTLPEGQRVHALRHCQELEMHKVYFEHAISKKWLAANAKDGSRGILSTGWGTAKAFLKR